ncbi:hypothetical protein [Planomonospora venezuelensis]|uniref:Uncharacterized protein n=1 Tax=Planomonospora venezuelensis TaxID=1999 RepID=A0A841D9Y4_PLAVE|nr:hypothetical protein [Planomonospora venezuelensis]MBB5967432.1 hypothetical protein [Planomonospora venezuelensis]GIN03951.1 hypothetical protein Pve01_56090 [Planomonospora venezuelensis]
MLQPLVAVVVAAWAGGAADRAAAAARAAVAERTVRRFMVGSWGQTRRAACAGAVPQ